MEERKKLKITEKDMLIEDGKILESKYFFPSRNEKRVFIEGTHIEDTVNELEIDLLNTNLEEVILDFGFLQDHGNIKKIIIKVNGFLVIEGYSLYNAINLEEVYIKAPRIIFGPHAFSFCNGLRSIIIKGKIEHAEFFEKTYFTGTTPSIVSIENIENSDLEALKLFDFSTEKFENKNLALFFESIRGY